MKNNPSEKGQVLIVIAITAVVLFAFAALAIDGTMVFSDRRHAQNAADISVLASALAKVRGRNYSAAALSLSTSNGYDNNGTSNIVEVYNPPADGPYAGNSEYIQVKITSHVPTHFAKILGVSEMTNYVQAVARATAATQTSLFGGNALVALNKTACPALEYNGSSSTTVTGSGIFVNSNCNTGSNQALNSSSGASGLTVPCMSVVGGVTLSTNATLTSPGINCGNSINNPSTQIADPLSTFATANIPCGTTDGQLVGEPLPLATTAAVFHPAVPNICKPASTVSIQEIKASACRVVRPSLGIMS